MQTTDKIATFAKTNSTMPQKRPLVAVYCSSCGDLPGEVTLGAQQIAAAIGQCGADLVYGGVNAGLMHTVAQAAHDAGAQIHGVIPSVFSHRADPLCHHIHPTPDLATRKQQMIAMADIFIVLPGGIGTLDEWISTLSDIMVREKTDPDADRPILVWNHADMYSGMAAQLAATAAGPYARGRRVDRSHIHPTPAALIAHLKSLLP